jgi:Uma2 family endonuclease
MLTNIRLISVREYHKMAETGIFHPEERLELIAGQIIRMSAKGTAHESAITRTERLLRQRLGDKVLLRIQSPVQLDDYSEPKPDISMVKLNPLDYETCDERDDDPQLVQFPCLIIEVLSPSTEAADRGKKFAKYRQSPTLQEYVLVQVAQPGVEVFRRNEQGKWVLSEYNLGEILRLESVDVEIAMSTTSYAYANLYRQVQFETETTDN